MAVSTEADALLPTDVFALTASPALSAREVITFPQSLYITLCVTAESVLRDFTLCGGYCCRSRLSHAVCPGDAVCCGTFAQPVGLQKLPIFSTSAFK